MQGNLLGNQGKGIGHYTSLGEEIKVGVLYWVFTVKKEKWVSFIGYQPTLDVIKKLAVVLGVASDALIFEANERGPGDDLRLQFEAVQRLDQAEKQVVKTVIESIIIRHDANQWGRASSNPSKPAASTG
jgi:hypothetical protein